ncbi:MAG: uroporphyrinogen-III C-methyltransferase [Planctomycetes bacterium]|nr:uroporphyrinogen-III C-methyltransferase [Planctomycetota bacterium]
MAPENQPDFESKLPIRVGRVYLVGAGPGDPGLLTLRGAECLRQADLVLYDGLVNPLLLHHTHANAERTCRAEGPTGRQIRQDEINQRLVAAAREGKTVVRLKGGDPFIFGRGSEEAAALRAAGIPFEVVPGITAATAAAVYTGISLTHRDHASAVAFITGHEDPAKPASALDYSSLAHFPGTLVFYMGLHRLEAITAALIAAGKPSTTPACVVCRATQPLQRTVTGSLADLPGLVKTAGLHPPSLVIVGDCVRVRDQARWFEDRPLFGQVIGITRPEDQADEVAQRAYQLGALPVLLPTIEIAPPDDWAAIDDVLCRLDKFDWIIWTSANGVRGLLDRLWSTGGDVRRLGSAKLACIGPATAAALATFSLRADVVPTEFRAESLAASLAPLVAGKRVLWARASRGRDVLPRELSNAGAILEQVVVYQNRDVTSFPAAEMGQLERGELDWIGLSSPSIARSLAQNLTPTARTLIGSRTRLASISPVTTAAAIDAGLVIAAEATTYTWEGLFQAMIASQ